MNIAILDDLPSDREQVAHYLRAYFSKHLILDTNTIFEFESGEAFLEAFTSKIFQIIFIDCCMEGISGLDTAKKIRETDNSSVLIFITNSYDYAVDGYKVKASGYLLKPYGYHNFEEILSMLDIKTIQDGQFIELETGIHIVRILLRDIIYCDNIGHYVQIHIQNGEIQKFRMTFSSLSSLLTLYSYFLPCYRGCIINMTKVLKMEELNFLMVNGDRIPFRKKAQALLMKKYTDYLFEKVRGSRR